MPHPEVPDGYRPDPAERGESTQWTRARLREMRRAARGNWGVPDDVKNEAIYQASKILTDPAAKARVKIAAMVFLLAADRVDQGATKLPPPAPPEDRRKRIEIPDEPEPCPGPGPDEASRPPVEGGP